MSIKAITKKKSDLEGSAWYIDYWCNEARGLQPYIIKDKELIMLSKEETVKHSSNNIKYLSQNEAQDLDKLISTIRELVEKYPDTDNKWKDIAVLLLKK